MSDSDKKNPFEEIDRILRTCFNCKRDMQDPSVPPCNVCKPPPSYPINAPDGQVFVCGACGRVSKSLYGDGTSGWDESCMFNAVLCYADSVEVVAGMVVRAKAVEQN